MKQNQTRRGIKTISKEISREMLRQWMLLSYPLLILLNVISVVFWLINRALLNYVDAVSGLRSLLGFNDWLFPFFSICVILLIACKFALGLKSGVNEKCLEELPVKNNSLAADKAFLIDNDELLKGKFKSIDAEVILKNCHPTIRLPGMNYSSEDLKIRKRIKDLG